MVLENEKITILYGSQTGNAQELAERIWRESKCYYFVGPVVSMDDYDLANLINEKCVIFVCSTTGQGEEPDNMKRFWKFLLKRNLPSNSLANLRFAVLGIGDSSYIKFNFAAKRLNKRLVQLGGNIIQPIGLGDEQHDLGYDAVAEPWVDSLWTKLIQLYPLPKNVTPLSRSNNILPRWNVTTKLLHSEIPTITQRSIYYSTRASNEFDITVIANCRETCPTHFQDVRMIHFKTNGEQYGPGDVLSLRPRNLPPQVDEFQRILIENHVDIKPETIFKISQITGDVPVPKPLKYEVSFQQLCEEYFDLTAVPRRYTFCVLCHLTDSDVEREKCLEFMAPEGQEAMYNYVTRPKRNIVEVLHDFPHATKNITRELLFELIPPIRPRDFSIASSYKAHKNEIHILVAIIKFRTKIKKERLGLCTNYLAHLKRGDIISVWIKKGTFKFPRGPDFPVIMVGPGTGMAPFRNYIHERAAEGTATKKSLVLFFGCRGQKCDFYCKEEFTKFQAEEKMNLIVAFSRDQAYKIYVQHKIVENMEMVWNMLKCTRSHIFVAGNSHQMPLDVRIAFVTVCEKQGKMSHEAAEAYIARMECENRYQQETWG